MLNSTHVSRQLWSVSSVSPIHNRDLIKDTFMTKALHSEWLPLAAAPRNSEQERLKFTSSPLWLLLPFNLGLPRWLDGKESACQCKRCEFNPWVRKIPWRKKWQPTPVFFFFFFCIGLFFFSFIVISWRLTNSQHCSGFCHTLTWISHGHSSILAWEIPWTEEPGRLWGHKESDITEHTVSYLTTFPRAETVLNMWVCTLLVLLTQKWPRVLQGNASLGWSFPEQTVLLSMNNLLGHMHTRSTHQDPGREDVETFEQAKSFVLYFTGSICKENGGPNYNRLHLFVGLQPNFSNLMCLWLTWASCWNADSDSVGLGWGLRFVFWTNS